MNKTISTTLALLVLTLLIVSTSAFAAPNQSANNALTITMVSKENRPWTPVYPTDGYNVVTLSPLPVQYVMNLDTKAISAVLTIDGQAILISKISETDYTVSYNGKVLHWNPTQSDLQASGFATATILKQQQKFDVKFWIQADHQRMWVTWNAFPIP